MSFQTLLRHIIEDFHDSEYRLSRHAGFEETEYIEFREITTGKIGLAVWQFNVLTADGLRTTHETN